MKKVLVLFAAFFLIVSFAAVAQDQAAAEQTDLFSQLDTDGNGSLDNAEIGAAYEQYTMGESEYLGVEDVRQKIESEGYMQEWDADGDGQLTQDEFTEGVLTSFDTNGNGTIEKEEMPEVGQTM